MEDAHAAAIAAIKQEQEALAKKLADTEEAQAIELRTKKEALEKEARELGPAQETALRELKEKHENDKILFKEKELQGRSEADLKQLYLDLQHFLLAHETPEVVVPKSAPSGPTYEKEAGWCKRKSDDKYDSKFHVYQGKISLDKCTEICSNSKDCSAIQYRDGDSLAQDNYCATWTKDPISEYKGNGDT